MDRSGEFASLFSIGEFSRISGITVKALRFYHEQQLLIPSAIDPQTGYRYYHESLVERARAIVYLRQLDLPIEQIALILRDASTDEEKLLHALEQHRDQIRQRIRSLKRTVRSLDEFINSERQAKIMTQQANEQVQERTIDAILIAGVRMKGRYSDCGKTFGRICRSFGRLIAGQPMMLHYENEYKEDDADFEPCLPVKQAKNVEGVTVRELNRTRCATLVHHGSYETLGDSYAVITKYVKDKGYSIALPTREVYLKGPGMIFKGNPKKYVTEIQFPIG